MTNKTVKFQIDSKSYEFPVLNGSDGPDVVDISNFYQETGMFTFDPGFMSTASCASKITYIDGDAGILRYRGYDIADLAQHKEFLEVAYLLLHGELPNKDQKVEFYAKIDNHLMVHEQLHFLLRGFPRKSHPMAVLMGAVSSLSAFYHDAMNMKDTQQRALSAFRMIAKMPTLVAMSYKYSIGQPFIYPRDDLNFTENFLYMMFALPNREYKVPKVLAKALDKIFVLHADHEQNASTSTVRLAGSTGADPYACITAGLVSLWGPAHGGANEAVIRMLEEIGSVDNIPEYIERVKNKDYRLMGFGHRVYKNYDPRATVLRETCKEVMDYLGHKQDDHLLTLALELEKIALSDDYFISRKLYPNVDFYSGLIYRAMNIPTQMFTCMFALARTAGWVAQWKEMIEDSTQKIGRPRQLYTGYTTRKINKGA